VVQWSGTISAPLLRPVHPYCNAGENGIVGNQITNLMRDLPYKDELTWWEPQHVQYRRLRGDVVEIVEVEVASKEGELLPLVSNCETQAVLHFKK